MARLEPNTTRPGGMVALVLEIEVANGWRTLDRTQPEGGVPPTVFTFHHLPAEVVEVGDFEGDNPFAEPVPFLKGRIVRYFDGSSHWRRQFMVSPRADAGPLQIQGVAHFAVWNPKSGMLDFLSDVPFAAELQILPEPVVATKEPTAIPKAEVAGSSPPRHVDTLPIDPNSVIRFHPSVPAAEPVTIQLPRYSERRRDELRRTSLERWLHARPTSANGIWSGKLGGMLLWASLFGITGFVGATWFRPGTAEFTEPAAFRWNFVSMGGVVLALFPAIALLQPNWAASRNAWLVWAAMLLAAVAAHWFASSQSRRFGEPRRAWRPLRDAAEFLIPAGTGLALVGPQGAVLWLVAWLLGMQLGQRARRCRAWTWELLGPAWPIRPALGSALLIALASDSARRAYLANPDHALPEVAIAGFLAFWTALTTFVTLACLLPWPVGTKATLRFPGRTLLAILALTAALGLLWGLLATLKGVTIP